MSSSLSIDPIDTTKDNLKKRYPQLCLDGHIPCPNTSTIICGSSGSGKTVLLANIFLKDSMLKGVFDEIYVLSETGQTDDVIKSIGVEDDHVFDDLEKGIKHMQKVMTINKAVIKAMGNDKAPMIALIYDDCLSSAYLLKHPFFKRSFIQSRHYNITVFCLVQHWTGIPRVCREQATNTILFQSNAETNAKMAEIFTPPGYSKREFVNNILGPATKPKFSFIYINKSQPFKTRYRIKFDTIIQLNRLDDDTAKKLEHKEEVTNDLKDDE